MSAPEVRHQEALTLLEQGHPRAALQIWRALLQADPAASERHLQAAALPCASDPLQHLRSRGVQLAARLLQATPADAEVALLGALLRGWGALCLPEAPERAQQHFERAWSCGRDPRLAEQLAALYRHQGLHNGAWALSPPAPDPEPLAEASPCAALGCEPCQQHQRQHGLQDPPPSTPQLHALPGGQAWLQHHTNPWRETHGLAVATAAGELLPALCRRYPWPWPACSAAQLHQQLAAQQLVRLRPGLVEPLQLAGPVLAVADLSAELYYHWLLESLPRLGQAWQRWHSTYPGLRVWHNGGASAWVQESLARLGVPADAVICGHRFPWIQAEQLLVPPHTSFGAPGQQALAWLRGFWQVEEAPPAAALRLYLPRGNGVQRRPLLGEPALLERLPGLGWQALPPGLGVAEQLRLVASAQRIVAPHGAALANLLAVRSGVSLLEWCNPAYAPPYFHSLSRGTGARHHQLLSGTTPPPLQEWLYPGPLAFPIDPGPDPTSVLMHPLAPC